MHSRSLSGPFYFLSKGVFSCQAKIQLSDHFTYPRLLRFVLPAVGTMLFTSIYGIVDGAMR